MDTIVNLTKALSIACFLYYGLSCVFANGMQAEFTRFDLSRYRKLTGVLEILGALGLTVGYQYAVVDVIAAGGLSSMMVLGIAVRLRVQDNLPEMLPAILLLAMNAFILVARTADLVKS